MYQLHLQTIQCLMQDFAFPMEAQTEIIFAYKTAFQDLAKKNQLQTYLQAYEKDCQAGIMEAIQLCARIAEEGRVNVYSVYMAVLILFADYAKAHYALCGFCAQVWKDNFIDFRYKLEECKLVKGVWGTFVPTWYIGFLKVDRFSFGKLQFEKGFFCREYCKNGVALGKDSVVVSVHIPRTGQSLSPQDVDEACALANIFFKEKYGLERVVFVCHSWLLYPKNKNILKPTSNLYAFISRFDIIEVEEYKDYKEVWRLFDKEYNEDLSLMPANTSLQRAYIDRMRKGEKIGAGYGVFVYEK